MGRRVQIAHHVIVALRQLARQVRFSLRGEPKLQPRQLPGGGHRAPGQRARIDAAGLGAADGEEVPDAPGGGRAPAAARGFCRRSWWQQIPTAGLRAGYQPARRLGQRPVSQLARWRGSVAWHGQDRDGSQWWAGNSSTLARRVVRNCCDAGLLASRSRAGCRIIKRGGLPPW